MFSYKIRLGVWAYRVTICDLPQWWRQSAVVRRANCTSVNPNGCSPSSRHSERSCMFFWYYLYLYLVFLLWDFNVFGTEYPYVFFIFLINFKIMWQCIPIKYRLLLHFCRYNVLRRPRPYGIPGILIGVAWWQSSTLTENRFSFQTYINVPTTVNTRDCAS